MATNKQQLLDAAIEAQDKFWTLLFDLEEALGVEIESTEDLSRLSLEELEARS